MKKFTIIYWSGTGNTELLANAIAKSVNNNDTEVLIKPVQQATIEDVMYADIVALGCPAYTNPSGLGEEMEELESRYMRPFIVSLKNIDLSGKRIGLFGTYDWGDGQWMRDWERQMDNYGIPLVDRGLAIHQDDEVLDKKAMEFATKLTQYE